MVRWMDRWMDKVHVITIGQRDVGPEELHIVNREKIQTAKFQCKKSPLTVIRETIM